MILQALYDYYERKAALGEIAPVGFENKDIPFIIVIDLEGNFKALKDTREKKNKKLMAKSYLVPVGEGRAGSNSWKKTNFLWDHYGYILGYPKSDALKDRKKRNDLLQKIDCINEVLIDWQSSELLLESVDLEKCRTLQESLAEESKGKDVQALIKNLKALEKGLVDSEKQLGTFRDSVQSLPDSLQQEPAIKAINLFYEREEYKKVTLAENWLDCAGINGANLTFQIYGDNQLVVEKKIIVSYQKEKSLLPNDEDQPKSLCLITGEQDYIERLHAATPLLGGQATGKLVGFQKNSGFDSYGKEQAFNAPVGKYAHIAYTTALNTLSKSNKNRIFLGDTTVMFWAEKENSLEQAMVFVLAKPKDNPDAGTAMVKQFYQSISSGKYSEDNSKRFYVLGLAPNAARISVRYWLKGSVGDFCKHIKAHFDDLEIVYDEKAPEFYALTSMISHTVLDYKLANAPPNLMGQVTEAVLKGTPYPQSLFQATIRRIRAEQHVTRTRAAIIKASLNRFNRLHHKKRQEITVALDKTNKNPAYLLGRLFAVLEKVQYKALKIETIRERYYGAFSSTPVTVYPQLMKLKNHHLAKLDSGKNFFENLIGEIIDGLDGSGIIPRQFSLEEQGRFAVGYYHQRQDLKYKAKITDLDVDNSEEVSNE